MIRTLLAAAAICAVAGPALADEEIDLSRCDNTPVVQLTRKELKWCDIADRMKEGMQKQLDNLARERGIPLCSNGHYEPTCR